MKTFPEKYDVFIANIVIIQYKKGNEYIKLEQLKNCLNAYLEVEDYLKCAEVQWLINNYQTEI